MERRESFRERWFREGKSWYREEESNLRKEAKMPKMEGIALVPYRERWEEGKLDYGIGIIGVGGVANWAHLPTYEMTGLNVVAAADVDEEAREIAKKRWGINKIFKDYRELLELEEVDLVDVTVHHRWDDVRVQITKDAGDAGKHILMHKPLARTYERAKEMVQIARQKRIKFAANQNSRWGPAHFATRNLIREGFIGKPQVIMIENISPVEFVTESMDEPAFTMLEWSVHHYDIMRWWLGKDPVQLYSTLNNHTNFTILKFEENIQACLRETTLLQGGANEHRYQFRIEGTEGAIKGRQGWHSHLKMPPDKLEVYSSHSPRQLEWLQVRFPANPIGEGGHLWGGSRYDLSYPYAGFLGSIADLMQSIEQDREPTCKGEDNLKTMQVTLAAYKSAKEGREVEISEIK